MNGPERTIRNYLNTRTISKNVRSIHTLLSIANLCDEKNVLSNKQIEELHYDMNKLIEFLCDIQECNVQKRT